MENSFDMGYIPDFHPGVTVKEWLEEREMSVKEFAIRLDRTEQFVLSLIGCKTSVTPDLALALEYVTGISAEFWLNKQQGYDLYLLRKLKVRKEVMQKTWLSTIPVGEMNANGWMEEGTENPVGKMLHYYGHSSVAAWKNYFFHQRLKVAFRISLEGTINPYALSAWLRRGEIQAWDMYLDEPYSKEALKKKLPEIVSLLLHPCEDVMDVLPEWLGKIGIKLFYTEPLTGVPIKGASRWIYGHPCIQLPKTQETYDNFAYTVLHELGHIYLHGKKEIFLENVGYLPEDPEAYNKKEAEADAFARKWIASDKDFSTTLEMTRANPHK